MKKRTIIILLISVIFLTSCTCEYNLEIHDNTFDETITLTSDNDDEIAKFSNSWEVPINKDEYGIGGDSEDMEDAITSTYEYDLNGNKLTFNHLFNKENFANSTAVYNCFNKLTLSEYNNTIIISTSSGATCFSKNPDLNALKINITVDRNVISNNADEVNDKTYTWNITKENANSKSIDLVLDNTESISPSEETTTEKATVSNRKYDKERYILAGAVFIVFLTGYLVVKAIQKKGDSKDVIDDQIDDSLSDEMDDE